MIDVDGHGTNVIGVAASSVNNTIGGAGILGNLMVLPVKVYTTGGSTSSNTTLAINWAANNGVKVISMSFAGSGFSSAEQAACQDAYENFGCVLVAGTGNSGTKVSNYPASHPFVIAVGASGASDTYATYSTRSDQIALVGTSGTTVPPQGLTLPDIGTSTAYGSFYGTSISTPEIASLAAILLSNGVPFYEALSRMARTADKIDAIAHPYATVAGHSLGTWNEYLGYGRINFYRSMKTLVPPVLDSAVASLDQVDLSFSAPPLSDTATSGYHVYRASMSGGPYTRLTASPLTGSTYVDSGVTAGQVLYYVVTALDSNAEAFETKKSNERMVTVPYPSPTVTPTFTASPTASPTPTITVTFTVSPTATISPTRTASPAYRAAGRGELFVAPVPATGQAWVYFEGDGGRAEIKIFNVNGELAWRGEELTQAGQAMRVRVSLDGWAWGVYYVVMELSGNRSGPARLLVGE